MGWNKSQGVAPLTEKRDRHSLRRSAQRQCTPIRRVPTTREGGHYREPDNSHGQQSLRHRQNHGHGGKAHSRARHSEHQARCCPATSTSQKGRPWRTNPRTRTRSRRRHHHTNPWAINWRRFGHQERQPRPGAAHLLLLDMQPQMQAQ